MNPLRIKTLIFPLLSLIFCTACMDDDDFTTSVSDRLYFSTDTLSLDTVITGQPTSTYSFSVYNPHAKNIRIRSVRLNGGVQSPFRVNVDGIYINEGYEGTIDIRKKDSIAVFVSLTVPHIGSEALQTVRDKIQFMLESGAVQDVCLEATGQDVHTLKGAVIKSDTTFSGKIPFHIFDSLYVSENATLTVSPGVTFYFHPGAELKIAGRLQARGTLQSPIVFRGDRLDYMFPNQPYDCIPGQWKGLRFLPRSFQNILDYCDIHSAQTGIRCDSSDLSDLKLRIENSMIHNMKGNALELRSCQAYVGNSQLSNALDNCVAIYGGETNFVHCTIANFYPFDFIRGGALYFANADGESVYPLRGTTFTNCILTGGMSDAVSGVSSDKESPFNYHFSHCLVAMENGETDENFHNVLWDAETNEVYGSKNFRPFNLDFLLFDFRLDSLSAAIGNADYEVTVNSYPFDRNGVSRTTDGHSDMGCYEFISSDPRRSKRQTSNKHLTVLR